MKVKYAGIANNAVRTAFQNAGFKKTSKPQWNVLWSKALKPEAYSTLTGFQRVSQAVLCCAVLCCAMLCYAMLCYAMLCYAMLFWCHLIVCLIITNSAMSFFVMPVPVPHVGQ